MSHGYIPDLGNPLVLLEVSMIADFLWKCTCRNLQTIPQTILLFLLPVTGGAALEKHSIFDISLGSYLYDLHLQSLLHTKESIFKLTCSQLLCTSFAVDWIWKWLVCCLWLNGVHRKFPELQFLALMYYIITTTIWPLTTDVASNIQHECELFEWTAAPSRLLCRTRDHVNGPLILCTCQSKLLQPPPRQTCGYDNGTDEGHFHSQSRKLTWYDPKLKRGYKSINTTNLRSKG